MDGSHMCRPVAVYSHGRGQVLYGDTGINQPKKVFLKWIMVVKVAYGVNL